MSSSEGSSDKSGSLGVDNLDIAGSSDESASDESASDQSGSLGVDNLDIAGSSDQSASDQSASDQSGSLGVDNTESSLESKTNGVDNLDIAGSSDESASDESASDDSGSLGVDNPKTFIESITKGFDNLDIAGSSDESGTLGFDNPENHLTVVDQFLNNNKDEFLKWFWAGSNGNDLILNLNACPEDERDGKSIRLEKDPPVIYALVLNDGDFPFKHKGEQWKLCKVGFTHRSIQDDANRIKEVKRKIKSDYKKDAGASKLFAVPISAVDTTRFLQTEKRIREKVGKPVLKDKANDIGLPFPKEWVLTTTTRIKEIEDKKNKAEESKRTGSPGDVIDIFKDFKDAAPPPAKYKDWYEADKVQRKSKTC